ncbi:CDP-diacylglycerol--glycerol-3-phosphate 3-phosphatidyltransferase, mitochondrial [Chelonus insularis]|uniref:CDP-diacylglycerol--glycerol-3-phosphate 3-phosphatidyltransferase, mitochondrial n=1 Tax=Chelonus insularis TaxID=460826 RepID=UPI00158DB9D2|nr:CDP-diacylglycerol--glycerol-3-phosphate 3-phosphatidyltransferase, mitochondrial [Chelonus insularis]
MVIKSFLWQHVYSYSTCPKVTPIQKTIRIVRNKMKTANSFSINVRNNTMKQLIVDRFSWLQEKAPGFLIDSSKVQIIHEPTDFYSILLEKAKNVRQRIILGSLYIGTGELEKNLIKAIEQSLVNSNGKVKVNILLDYMRGTRGQTNSVKMLEPLLKNKYVDSCSISLYHTPKLKGLLKLILPNRFNELIGLQHMKIYIFDDSVIISGANLSNDYFVNRQDRYFLIEDCKELSDFYYKLISLVAKFSFQLLPDNKLVAPILFNSTTKSNDQNTLKTTVVQNTTFIELARNELTTFYTNEIKKSHDSQHKLLNGYNNKSLDTWIFPLIQMGQLEIFYECQITQKLLKTAPEKSILQFATGYFNLTKEYSNALLNDCKASCNLLTAHPTANGFYGAKGIAGQIPAAYTIIEKSFFDSCERMNLNNRIKLEEYIRPGWTYHAKGLWYTLPNEQKPSLTLIGSSNFGYRSVHRDLETQLVLITRNAKLQNCLQEEYDRLRKYAQPVKRESFSQYEKSIPNWVYAAVFLFRYYF